MGLLKNKASFLQRIKDGDGFLVFRPFETKNIPEDKVGMCLSNPAIERVKPETPKSKSRIIKKNKKNTEEFEKVLSFEEDEEDEEHTVE